MECFVGNRSDRRVQLKCDGLRWRTGGEVKGKLANGVGSQYSSHYLGTWCIQHYYRWCAHLGCQQSTELTPPADLNGLVRFAERRNLVSARVPSHFKRSLPAAVSLWCFFPDATAAFSGRWDGRAADVSACATGNNPPAGAHECRKNRPVPVFVCLPVEIGVAVVLDCSRLDKTHFADLRRMCRGLPLILPARSKWILCKSGRVGSFRWRIIRPQCEIHRIVMCWEWDN